MSVQISLRRRLFSDFDREQESEAIQLTVNQPNWKVNSTGSDHLSSYCRYREIDRLLHDRDRDWNKNICCSSVRSPSQWHTIDRQTQRALSVTHFRTVKHGTRLIWSQLHLNKRILKRNVWLTKRIMYSSSCRYTSCSKFRMDFGILIKSCRFFCCFRLPFNHWLLYLMNTST